jgi:hypothetical protein
MPINLLLIPVYQQVIIIYIFILLFFNLKNHIIEDIFLTQLN